ncbi:MAG TPA: hypothetical protein VGJ17_06160, partial [Candidatus Limnocylindrales bacterium]
RARSDFRYCRIGFCLLHSEASAAGRPYRATTPEGIVEGRLPELVGPQLVVDGRDLPLFPACSALSVEVDGAVSNATFEGSLFVMEDQRNWTDASFKTCCEAGGAYPYPARSGQEFTQRVTISASAVPPLASRPQASRPRLARIRELVVDPEPGGWPALGLGMSSDVDRALQPREAQRLAELKLDHLRVDLHLQSPRWQAELVRASAAAEACGAALEVALFGGPATPGEIDGLGSLLPDGPPAVSRVLVFEEATAANHVTPGAWLQAVAGRVGSIAGHPVVHGGTDGDFAELNRERPDFASPIGLVYAMNPQVHAFDEASLVETLPAQATTVRTAREFANGGPLAISPVTFRQRFNPVATEAPVPAPGTTLPAAVDPRQLSLFGAGWTLGSIASLAGAEVAAITYYETIGWRGVMESSGHRKRPPSFPSRAGQVFPLYHVFADLADRRSARRQAIQAGDAPSIAGLALRGRASLRVLLANLAPETQEVAVGPLPGRTAWVRLLDEHSYGRATSAPAGFRAHAERVRLRNGSARLRLGPFAYVRLDIRLDGSTG